eukprot:SAG11_NODE_28043_length_326_cov_0.629956_2_plen_25_part_01
MASFVATAMMSIVIFRALDDIGVDV